MDMLVEKLFPPSGGSRETARRLPPRTPQHLYFQTPIGLKSKTALITKRWRKKGPQLLPEERIIDDARGWAGRLGVHSKNQLHLLRVGWLAMESVHLIVRVVQRMWFWDMWVVIGWIYPPKIANISQIRVEIQGPQLQELRHVSCFLGQWSPKKLQCIPQEIQENAGTEWTC